MICVVRCPVESAVRIPISANSADCFVWTAPPRHHPIRIFHNRSDSAPQRTMISAVEDLPSNPCQAHRQWIACMRPDFWNMHWTIVPLVRRASVWCHRAELYRIAIASLWFVRADCTDRRADSVCFVVDWRDESRLMGWDCDRRWWSMQRCKIEYKHNLHEGSVNSEWSLRSFWHSIVLN